MRRMGIGLGVGINRSNYAQGIFSAYQSRVVADGGVTEAGACVDAVSGLLQTASLLLIPSGYKSGKAYAEIPTNGNGDLTWTRASTALRTNSSGLLESMGSGVPRLSYMYGSCPALLLEPQRTNLVLQSNAIGNATWAKIASASGTITATDNYNTSPDGNTNATRLVINNLGSAYASQSFTCVNGLSYTISIYAKSNTSNSYTFQLRDGYSGSVSSNLTITPTWQRFTFTFTASGTTAEIQFRTTVLGSYDLSVYGAQCEVGAYPTTLIPTTTASATRIADSFSRNNIYTNGLITSSGGTWFVELRGNLSYTVSGFLRFGIGDTNTLGTNSLVIRTSGTSRIQIYKLISGAAGLLYTTLTDTVKIAIKWNGTSADVFVNGTKEISATTFSTTNMEFLTGEVNSPTFVQAMALYSTALTDTQCQTLTTL